MLSWLVLRGRCSQCQHRISVRYPLVEITTGLLFAWNAAHWGPTAAALVWCGFSAVLLALALIDWDTTLLPDSMTLPLLWVGLMATTLGWTGINLLDAVWALLRVIYRCGVFTGFLNWPLAKKAWVTATLKLLCSVGGLVWLAGLGADFAGLVGHWRNHWHRFKNQ